MLRLYSAERVSPPVMSTYFVLEPIYIKEIIYVQVTLNTSTPVVASARLNFHCHHSFPFSTTTTAAAVAFIFCSSFLFFVLDYFCTKDMIPISKDREVCEKKERKESQNRIDDPPYERMHVTTEQ